MTIAQHKINSGRRIHRIAATAGVVAAIAVAGTGVAEAAQTGTLGPNQGASYATWFFGRTEVCVKNLSSTQGGSFNWVSSTSSGYRALAPSEEYCMTRSFAGFRIFIQNTTWNSTLTVRFPIGP